MKKVSNYLKVETINLDLKSKEKTQILKELYEGFSVSEEIIDKKRCYDDIIEREKMGSTGIGKGVAIPHAKTSGVKDIILTIGISKNGVNYDSIDDKNVNLIFMFLSPVQMSQEYLVILARLSRLIKDDMFREQLINANTKEEIFEILDSKEV